MPYLGLSLVIVAAVAAVVVALESRVPVAMGLVAGTAAMVASLLGWDRSADALGAAAWICFALGLALSVAPGRNHRKQCGPMEAGDER